MKKYNVENSLRKRAKKDPELAAHLKKYPKPVKPKKAKNPLANFGKGMKGRNLP